MTDDEVVVMLRDLHDAMIRSGVKFDLGVRQDTQMHAASAWSSAANEHGGRLLYVIDRLRAENTRLRAALEQYAKQPMGLGELARVVLAT